jgi:protoporphyrinogen oxidase
VVLKIVILGAGLTGLSTAYHLSQLKIPFQLFEQENQVGGLCRTEKIAGFYFDYTSHLLFFKESYPEELVKKLLGSNLKRQRRKAWIYSHSTYRPYPFQTSLYHLPAEVKVKCVLGYIRAWLKPAWRPKLSPDETLHHWILRKLGPGIAQHFMFPYNEKLWQRKLTQIVAQPYLPYIPVPKLEEVIKGALSEEEKDIGYNPYFYYPKQGGIQVLAEKFSQQISSPPFLKYQAQRIDLKEKTITFQNQKEISYDYLISTLPLKELVRILFPVPEEVKKSAQRLKFLSVLNLNLGINRPQILDKHWVYWPEKKYLFYRVGFPMNFAPSMAPPGKSSLSLEISYRPEEKIKEEKITEQATEDLIKAGLLKNRKEIIVLKELHLKYAYVIFDRYYKASLRILRKFLKKNNIYSIGRYGGWNYSTMGDAILAGKKTAFEILTKAFPVRKLNF